MLAFDVEVDVVTIHSFYRLYNLELVATSWESTLSLSMSSCYVNKALVGEIVVDKVVLWR